MLKSNKSFLDLKKNLDMIKSRKGEWLLVLEDNSPLLLVCRQNGLQVHLEEKQLDLNSRCDFDIDSKIVSDKQRRAYLEFHRSSLPHESSSLWQEVA